MIFLVLDKDSDIILTNLNTYYYETNISTKQPQTKKNPWFSCKNVYQGRKSSFI